MDNQIDRSRAPVPVVPGPTREVALYTRAPAATPPDDEVDLREVWRILRQQRWTILSVCGVVVTSTILATLLMWPVYRATALVEIRPAHSFVQLRSVAAPAAIQRRDRIETQSRIIRSESVAKAVIESLGLQSLPEFTGEHAQRGFFSGLRSTIVAVTKGLLTAGGSWTQSARQDWEILQAFLERVEVSPIRDSMLVEISFDSFDPELASDGANAIVAEYLRLGSARRFEAASGAKTFLESELVKARNGLETSERALNAFARRENIVDVDGNSDLITARVTELSSELTRVMTERIAAESLLIQIRKSTGARSMALLESELTTTLREEIGRYKAEYVQLSRIYKSGYPKLVQLRARISQIKTQIDAETDRLAAGVLMDFDKTAKREQLLRAELEGEKSQLLDLKDRAIQYHILQREWETNRQLHVALLEQIKQVGVSAGMEVDGVTVIDVAGVPVEPHSPRMGKNVATASGVGLVLGLGLAFLLAYLDDIVRTPEMLEAVTGLVSLGAVPKVKESDLASLDGPERVAEAHRWCPASEALRSVRTNLLLSSNVTRNQVFQVTSATAGEGKTTTAANLAILLAQPGLRVLLIDGDLRKPRLHKIFGVPRASGLSDVLRGNPKVEPYPTGVHNLFLLPAGDWVEDPAELLSSVNMEVLIESVSESYDYVIIDSPPVLPLTDAALVSSRVHGVIVVASAEETRKKSVADAVRRLQLVGAPLLGVVLNMADEEPAGGGYYGGYYGEMPDEDADARSGSASV